MSSSDLPYVFSLPAVSRLLEHHRKAYGSVLVASRGCGGVPIEAGDLPVARLVAEGPERAVEALKLALEAAMAVQLDERERNLALGRHLRLLAERLRTIEGRFDADLEARTAELERKNQKLATVATTDSLTGLLNRRAVEERIATLDAIAEGGSFPLAVIMCDLDHFKSINDCHGHLVGDAVLSAAATVLRERCRHTDEVGRWGGEEFIIFLPGCLEESAGQIAAELCELIRSIAVDTMAGPVSVTASFGVAAGVLSSGEGTARELIEKADRCLYRAKRQGRDRVICASAGVAA